MAIANKIKNNRIILIVLLMMVICFISSTLISVGTIGNVINGENESMATLLADNIYDEIYMELQKNSSIGKAMSASTELQDILLKEDRYTDTKFEKEVKEILNRYTNALDCNTAFLISTSSNRYYTQDGFNKVIDTQNDEHDVWFKIFMESGNAQSFDIDIDEAHDHIWTVFINNRVYDDQGNLIGVCGIGTEMADIQDIIMGMQDDYDIAVSIVDRDGFVQVDMYDINIDTAYYNFSDLDIDYDSNETHYIGQKDGYTVTKYMDDLGWVLLIHRQIDMKVLVMEIVARSLVVMTVLYLLFLIITTIAVRRENKAMKQDVMLESYEKLADIYDVMYILNLNSDSLREIKSDIPDVSQLFSNNEKFSEQKEVLTNSLFSEAYRERMSHFLDFTNVSERFKRKDSSSIEFITKKLKWYRLRVVAIRENENSSIDNVLLLVEDINEERKKEESLRLETETAKAASDAKGRFLASMSHEIRTPINAILGMDTMILRESNEHHVKEYAMTIQNAGHTLLSLINDILDISKIESGKMEIVPVRYELSSLIHDVVNMVRFKAEKKGLEVRLIIDKTLPTGLFGDDVRIRQIMVNLMNNAVKYTEQGCVTLRVTGTNLYDNIKLHISVEDTGIGIKEEDLSKLFEDFVRIEEARNRNIEGTGLGMGITVQLLQLMNSKLEVQSVYGEGSVFSFDIKQKILNSEPIGDIEKRLSQKADNFEYNALFVAPDARVLVVDDNATNRMVFASLLKETEMVIEESSGGKEALEYIMQTPYDIIFLDHMMPDMDGIEIMKQIKNTPNHPNVSTPVIALTANAISGAKEKYLTAGFNEYLSKPIIPEKLEQMLVKLLPEEKKKTSDKKRTMSGKSTVSMDIDLPSIEGIDWYYASLHLSDKDSILNTLKNFAGTIELESDNIKKIFDKLLDNPEDTDVLNEYRVKVHAMKSTATLLGFVPIAGMAATLEFAARDGKLDTIRDMTEHFIASWNGYKEKLSFISNTDSEKIVIEDSNVIVELLNQLKDSIQIFDVDSADAAVAELTKYQYDAKVEQLIERLSAAVTNLDVDLSLEICDNISEFI